MLGLEQTGTGLGWEGFATSKQSISEVKHLGRQHAPWHLPVLEKEAACAHGKGHVTRVCQQITPPSQRAPACCLCSWEA